MPVTALWQFTIAKAWLATMGYSITSPLSANLTATAIFNAT